MEKLCNIRKCCTQKFILSQTYIFHCVKSGTTYIAVNNECPKSPFQSYSWMFARINVLIGKIDFELEEVKWYQRVYLHNSNCRNDRQVDVKSTCPGGVRDTGVLVCTLRVDPVLCTLAQFLYSIYSTTALYCTDECCKGLRFN